MRENELTKQLVHIAPLFSFSACIDAASYKRKWQLIEHVIQTVKQGLKEKEKAKWLPYTYNLGWCSYETVIQQSHPYFSITDHASAMLGLERATETCSAICMANNFGYKAKNNETLAHNI